MDTQYLYLLFVACRWFWCW